MIFSTLRSRLHCCCHLVIVVVIFVVVVAVVATVNIVVVLWLNVIREGVFLVKKRRGSATDVRNVWRTDTTSRSHLTFLQLFGHAISQGHPLRKPRDLRPPFLLILLVLILLLLLILLPFRMHQVSTKQKETFAPNAKNHPFNWNRPYLRDRHRAPCPVDLSRALPPRIDPSDASPAPSSDEVLHPVLQPFLDLQNCLKPSWNAIIRGPWSDPSHTTIWVRIYHQWPKLQPHPGLDGGGQLEKRRVIGFEQSTSVV